MQSSNMSESAEYKAAKLTRRNAKASLTRLGRALLHRITNQRSVDEEQETFANVEKLYDLVQKHEKFTELIEEDEAFEVEEHWLEKCQRQFLDLESRAKEYVQETLNKKGSSETADNEQGGITVDDRKREYKRRRNYPNKNHHPLLHPGTNLISMLSSVLKTKEALLPVVAAFVVGRNGKRKEANILMDSGARISLVRDGVARRLKLEGKDVTVTMTTIGGQEEELKTKMYEVPIRSKENNCLFSVNAIGIPCISDEIKEVEVEAIERHLGLKKNVLSRGSGKLDVLIGIDHASMHTGKIKQVGILVACHSPLGWLVFGATQGSVAEVNKVLRVGVST